MSKTLGQMTPEERKAAIRRAVKKVSAELQANAPAIAKVLADFDAEHAIKVPAAEREAARRERDEDAKR